MTTLPLGIGAYKRQYAHEPEVQLVNRFVEKTPTNLKEHIALLGRPGDKFLATFTPEPANGKMRGYFSKLGQFNSDLFIVSGSNLWRYDGTTKTHITGVIGGTDAPRLTWAKGIGYEFLFIADGTKFQWYGGGSKASGVLTSDGTQAHTDVVDIDGVHYTWTGSLTDPLSDGTAAHPWVVLPGASVAADLENMAAAINFDGVPGTDFSSTLGGPNLQVSATSDATTMTVTYLTNSTGGNTVTTTVSGTHLTWGAATLAGGGVHALMQVAVPEAQPVESCATLASYVLASIADTQKFYYLNPGETTIDPLSFAEKESAPDPIVDMVPFGDVMIIAGAASMEFWSATGDNTEPFAPIEGRAMPRGIVPGTLVVVDEMTFIFVGNDWRVYSTTQTYTTSHTPISDHGIEERIRVQLRREAGIT